MSVASIARSILASVGTADEDALVEAIGLEVSLYATRLSEAVEAGIAKLHEPVSWRQALVLEHHGIARKTAKTYTVAAFDEAMDLFDHSECDVDVWDAEALKVKKGCPIRMAELRAEKAELETVA